MSVRFFALILLAGLATDKGLLSQNSTPSAQPAPVTAPPVTGAFTSDELHAFAALNPIDTHAHVRRIEPAFNAMLNRLNLHLLDIVLVDDTDPEEKDLRAESKLALRFIHSVKGRAAFCTSIDPYTFREPGFAATTIHHLNRDFSRGAIAVKIWKNIGMEIKNPDGSYLLPDDPVFAPIYKDIATHNKTLVAHVADPDSAWQPLNPASPDYSYYSQNTLWYPYSMANPPSKVKILAARDHILEQNPNLRLVGAHLGSMESNLGDLAAHLDRYPNFAVDMASRIAYFMQLPRAEAISFILKYQDRLIYATDLSFTANDPTLARTRFWEQYYARDWRYLATRQTVEADGVTAEGLALPDSVLRKLYHDNAVHWFPGIVPGAH